MATTAATTTTPRRRNSIDTTTKTPTLILHHPPSPSYTTTTTSSSTTTSSTTTSSTISSSADYELVSLKPPSYTSLRDILPSTTTFIQSPKPPSFNSNSNYQISIRNRLVKQAAWAYLQPMSTSPGSAASTVFHRLWNRFSNAVLHLISHICTCFL